MTEALKKGQQIRRNRAGHPARPSRRVLVSKCLRKGIEACRSTARVQPPLAIQKRIRTQVVPVRAGVGLKAPEGAAVQVGDVLGIVEDCPPATICVDITISGFVRLSARPSSGVSQPHQCASSSFPALNMDTRVAASGTISTDTASTYGSPRR